MPTHPLSDPRRWPHLPVHHVVALTIAFGAMTSAQPAAAQDTHYWGFENGARATLLGGAVVAGSDDLGAAFYNPSGLTRASSGQALTMFVKTITDVTVELDGGDGVMGTSSVGASAPGFLAARLPVSIVDGDVLAFSFIARRSSKIDLGGDLVRTPSPGSIEAQDLFLFQDIYDGWYGISWAVEHSSLAFGASLFLSNVSYRQRIQLQNIVSTAGSAEIVTDDLDFSFAARRLTAKLGATWRTDDLTLGATLSPPSVGIPGSSGSASVGYSRVAQGSGIPAAVAQTRQDGVTAEYRKPLSVALGAELAMGSVDLLATAEWFDAVDEYDVLETTSFDGQRPPVSVPFPIRERRRNVLNVAGGFAWEVAGGVALFASGRTDRSYRPRGGEGFVGLGGYDLTHSTAGIGLSPGSIQVWLGVMYASGEDERAVSTSPLPTARSVRARTRFERTGLVGAFSAAF